MGIKTRKKDNENVKYGHGNYTSAAITTGRGKTHFNTLVLYNSTANDENKLPTIKLILF